VFTIVFMMLDSKGGTNVSYEKVERYEMDHC
jgi:hypothetical protein